MKLSECTLPMPYEDCKDLAIVYSYEVAVLWYTAQQEHGDPRYIGTGLQLADGRWMMYGDILTEVYPGGLFGWACEYLTPEVMEKIEVIPLADLTFAEGVPQLVPEESPSPVS